MAFKLANAFYHYFWVATPSIQLFMVWWMVRRKLHRDFPFFVSYLAYAALTVFALMLAAYLTGGRYTPSYAATYYSHLIGCLILRFCVIYEIVRHVLHSYPAIQNLIRLLVRWAFALLLLVGVMLAAYSPGETQFVFANSLWLFERTASLIQVGLLILLLMFSSYFKLSWREYVFGMALGLGIYASIELALSSVYVDMWVQAAGTAWKNRILDLIDMGTYHCCVLIWLTYLLAPERKRGMHEHFAPTDLTDWNAELDRLAHP